MRTGYNFSQDGKSTLYSTSPSSNPSTLGRTEKDLANAQVLLKVYKKNHKAADNKAQLFDLSSRGPEKPAATDLSAAEESEEEVEYLGSPSLLGTIQRIPPHQPPPPIQELSYTALSRLDALGQHELLFTSLSNALRHLIFRVNEISDRLDVLGSRHKAILERVSCSEIPVRPCPFASDAPKQLFDLSSRGPEKPAATDLSTAEESEEEVEYLGSPVLARDYSENPSTPAPAAK
ncbi:hypothetical protein VTO42DRAFT_9019 [Malbranchea cinnamomea]